MSQSLHSSNLSGMSTPTANAVRLANNKRIIFTDGVDLYQNAQKDTVSGAGVETTNTGKFNQKKAKVGVSKKQNIEATFE